MLSFPDKLIKIQKSDRQHTRILLATSHFIFVNISYLFWSNLTHGISSLDSEDCDVFHVDTRENAKKTKEIFKGFQFRKLN